MEKKIFKAFLISGLTFMLLAVVSPSNAFAGCAPRNPNANWPTSCGFRYNCCVSNTEAAQMQPAAAPAPAPAPANACLSNHPWLANFRVGSNSNDIHFAFNKFSLTSAAKATLRKIAVYLKCNPRSKLEIQGITDIRGTVDYNMSLGFKRADAAKYYLENLGIRAGRLIAVSFGKGKQFCMERTSSCYAKNRTDHFVAVSR